MNNSTSVLLKIANLYAEQLMSDICLVVDNNRYPAHRVILCASSEVFQVCDIADHTNLVHSNHSLNVGNADEPGVE